MPALVPSRARLGFAFAVLTVCALHSVAYAAEPDRVFLSEQTIAWSTVKYATTAENGFVAGSLDTKTIVDRTFKSYVIENRYLKVTLVPEFGGRIPATRSFIARRSAFPTGSRPETSITTG